MAEAFAAVGLASSIVAFVDFAQKVVSRLNEFSGDLKDGTNALVQIQTQLPVIIDGLRRIRDRVDSGKLDDRAKAAIEPIVTACHAQVELLSGVLDHVLPASDASKWERRKKAIRSLAADSKVKKASEILSQHLQTLTFYHSIGDPHHQPIVKEAFWLVPFDRNSNFVGRDSIFDQIDQAFQASVDTQPKVALYGLGGIGKSQIALEYCFRTRHKQPNRSIFWVNAATVARFEESFKRMEKEFGLSNGEGGQNDSLMSVKSWLETKSVAPWVMVIDNVDDETAFFHEKCHNDKTPSQALPRCSHGQLLFTSRTRDVAFDLASPETPISVDFLSTEEGLDLLRKRLRHPPPDSHLIELLTELGHIPLAITQAISFIMKRKKSVEQYLELYRTGEKSMSRLLSHEFIDHGRQEQTMESVARTWQISFEWIQKNKPDSAEILCLMGFYQHHGVPKLLLRRDDVDDFEFEDSIAVLQAFSLLEVNQEGNSYSMHRLLQVTTKLWLEQNGPAELEEWALAAMRQVTICFSERHKAEEGQDWQICQSLLPHADILLAQHFVILMRESDLEKAELLLVTGNYIGWEMSDTEDGNRRLRRSLDLRKWHLGSDHSYTWSSMQEYFRLLIKPGSVHPPDMDSYAVAEMGQALLNHEREVFGPRHPNTIESMSDIARFLDEQGEFEDSETMHRETWKLSEEVEGSDHIHTIKCMERLGILLLRMNWSEETLEIWRKSVEIRTELFGPMDRTVLMSKVNLANCLSRGRRHDEAISLGREVMRVRETVLGPRHPDTLTSARSLAIFLFEKGSYQEAKDILDHVLNILQTNQRAYIGRIRTQEIMELRQEIEEEEIEIDSSLSESSAATVE